MLLAPSATVLGNIAIGTGVIVNAVGSTTVCVLCQLSRTSLDDAIEILLPLGVTYVSGFSHAALVAILQCSVVIRPVPDFSRCSGVPAKVKIRLVDSLFAVALIMTSG